MARSNFLGAVFPRKPGVAHAGWCRRALANAGALAVADLERGVVERGTGILAGRAPRELQAVAHAGEHAARAPVLAWAVHGAA
jgi:hypothetical protein